MKISPKKIRRWIVAHKRGVMVGSGLALLLGLMRRRRLGPERYHLWDAYIDEASRRYGVPHKFIRSVMLCESDFQPYVVSRAGAMGLMQIMPATAMRCGLPNPFDPRGNILCGVSVLRKNIDRYGGDLALTMAAYNAGPGRAHNPPARTLEYVRCVLGHYRSS